jgi:hypothetical protein
LRQGGIIMRQTAAEARRLLIEMASKKLDVPVADLTVTDGVVHSVADPKKRVSYAELIGGRKFDSPVEFKGEAQQLTVQVKAPLKKPEQFKVIGKPYPRRDMPGKVFGTLQQVADLKLPNMAHARMLRPPVAGAVPVTVDEKSIAGIPGAKVVWIKNFLGVVAEKEWNAVRAAQALKVTWSESKPNFPGHDKLFEHIRNAPVVNRSGDRNVRAVGPSQERVSGEALEAAFKKAAVVLEGEYEYPTMSHASMGPACAVADVREDSATVYTSTQKPFDCQLGISELLGFPPEKVRAIWMFGTGGYARDAQGDATADAAVLSQHLKRPVRVQYMRHESLAWDPKGTASVSRNRVGLDADGNIVAYENVTKSFSMEDCNTRERHPGGHAGRDGAWFPAERAPLFRNARQRLHVRERALGMGADRAADGAQFAAAHDAHPRPLRSAADVRKRIVHRRDRGPYEDRSNPIPLEVSEAGTRARIVCRSRQAIWLGHAAFSAQGPAGQYRGGPWFCLSLIGGHLHCADRRGARASRHGSGRDSAGRRCPRLRPDRQPGDHQARDRPSARLANQPHDA